MTTTALDQRQRIIERLLTVNAKLDRATPELRLVLTDERDRLTRILARYDRGLIRIGQGLSTDVTARELVKELNRLNRELQRLSDSGDSTNQERLETQIAQLEDALFDLEDGWEKQPRHNGPPVYRRENPYPMGRPATDDSLILPSPDAPPLNASEINRMLGTLLGAQQAKRIYRNVDQFTVAMNRLNAFLDQSRWHTFLHPDNPFRLQHGAMNDLRSHYSNRGFNSPQDFIRDQEVAAERYADSGDASGLVLSLPLYQHRDALDAWISLEQSRIRDGGSQDCINSRFAEETAQAAWQALKQWAETAADIEQADADAAYMTRHLATPLRASLRAEGNDLVTLQMPAAASRPRFLDENGHPYAHTQVLCWRYRKDDPERLGRCELDYLTPNLMTVGLLYTDADGRPTLDKPDFLSDRDHHIQMQLNPETGDVLLLEGTRASRPTKMVPGDPLIANWFSHGMPEHHRNINAAIESLGGNPVRRPESVRNLGNVQVGLPIAPRLTETLTGTDVTGLFELTSGYHYGFMLLPLGFGSIAIKDVASLPGQIRGDQPVAVKTESPLPAGEQDITLPRTLRQYSLECFQARDALLRAQLDMQQANHYKHLDIVRIERLKHWLQCNIDYPKGGIDPDNQSKQKALNEQLGKMQRAIRDTQFIDRVNETLNDKDDAAKYFTYLKQKESYEAFARYRAAVDRGFALLEDEHLMRQIKTWAEAQEDIARDQQDNWVDTLIEGADFLERNTNARWNHSCTLDWAVSSSLTNTITAPYTALIYDGLLGVMTLLAQSHRDDELFGRIVLPALHQWLTDPDLNEVIRHLVPALVENRTQTFSSVSLDRSETELLALENAESPLSKLLGVGFDVGKSTFLRGPGAPALIEGILELSSMVLEVGYRAPLTVKTNVLIRAQTLHMATFTGLHVLHHKQQLTDLMVRFTRTKDRLNPSRLLNERTLTQRAYGGDSWGTTQVMQRFEGYAKTGVFLYTKASQLIDFMQHMGEEAWENPTDADFRSAAYQYLEALEGGLNEGSTLLTVPAMIQFWRSVLKKPVNDSLLNLFSRQLNTRALGAGRLLAGTDEAIGLGRWLAQSSGGAVTGMSILSTWANRLSFAASAVATTQSLMDVGHNLELGREYQAMRSMMLALGHGAVVAGSIVQSELIMVTLLGCNTLPVAGQVLFVAGVAVAVGMIAWDYYWDHWGRSHFYSDTFVYFDDVWTAMTRQPHFNSYIKEEYGANEEIRTITRTIQADYQSTFVDTVRDMHTNDVNTQLRLINAFNRLFGLEERHDYLPYDRSVSWRNFNILAIPRLLDTGVVDSREGEIDTARLMDYLELEEADVHIGLALSAGDDPEDEDDRKELAARNLIDWFKRGREQVAACRANPSLRPEQAALSEIVWPTLLAGRFPEELNIAELVHADFPAVEGDAIRQRRTLESFLARWQQLVQPKGER